MIRLMNKIQLSIPILSSIYLSKPEYFIPSLWSNWMFGSLESYPGKTKSIDFSFS